MAYKGILKVMASDATPCISRSKTCTVGIIQYPTLSPQIQNYPFLLWLFCILMSLNRGMATLPQLLNAGRSLNRVRGKQAGREAARLKNQIFRQLNLPANLVSQRHAQRRSVRNLFGDALQNMAAGENGESVRDLLTGGDGGELFIPHTSDPADKVATLLALRTQVFTEAMPANRLVLLTIRGEKYDEQGHPYEVEVVRVVNRSTMVGNAFLVGVLAEENAGHVDAAVRAPPPPGTDLLEQDNAENQGSDKDDEYQGINPETMSIQINVRNTQQEGENIYAESGGGFFRYWLSSRFPQSLAFLQVYKREEQQTKFDQDLRDDPMEEAVARTGLEEEFDEEGDENIHLVEIDCFANTLILLGVEAEKIGQYLSILAQTRTPWLPSNKLGEVAKLLKLNFHVSYYSNKALSRTMQTRQFTGVEGQPYLPIARVGDHYVPDIYSGWTRVAAKRLREIFERVPEDRRPLEVLRRAKAILPSGHLRCYTDEELIKNPRLEATYGELLSYLLFDELPDRTASGCKRKSPNATRSDDQLRRKTDFLEDIEPDELLLRSEMYLFFTEMLKDRSLPIDADPETMKSLIESYSKTDVTPHTQRMLNCPPVYLDEYWGEPTRVGNGVIPGRDCMSYKRFEELYQAHGERESMPWVFADPMVKKASILTGKVGSKGEPEVLHTDIPMHWTLIAFDFETDPTGVHEAYMCSIAYFVDPATDKPFSFRNIPDICNDTPASVGATMVEQTFFGLDCATRMVDFIIDHFESVMVMMVAHNLRYDLNQLMAKTKCTIEKGIFKSASRTNCANLVLVHSLPRGDRENRKVAYAIDSLPIVGMSLANMAKTYKLPVQKEILPYEYYSKKALFSDPQKYIPCSMCPSEPIASVEPYLVHGATLKDFEEACERAQAQGKYEVYDPESKCFDPHYYAAFYCEQDCRVLLEGFCRTRIEMARLPVFRDDASEPYPCRLDVFHCVSVSQFSSHVLGISGCFDGTCAFSGSIRDYLSAAVVGGRVMCNANLPHKATGRNDFDACSLYPTAMKLIAERLGGFPIGLPIYWCPGCGVLIDEDPSINYYVITIRITKVGIPLRFPILSYKTESGGRHFTNDLVGRVLIVDKIAWEDAKQFQAMEGEILCGLYFNNGGNTRIGRVITGLYEDRKRLKAAGEDAAQNVRKVVMNSGYGRTIMKPVATDMHFISGASEIDKYILRHAVSICNISYVRKPDFAVIERAKSLYPHFSQPQIGAFILSASKRVMNEVMCLAESLPGVEIDYQDTDSMHINDDGVPILADAFQAKYGRSLIGEDMGEFHCDFEKIRGYLPPVSVRSVYCGKKMYMDELEYVKADGSGEKMYKDHIRMKGVPSDVIVATASEMGISVYDFYCKLLDGEGLSLFLWKIPSYSLFTNLINSVRNGFDAQRSPFFRIFKRYDYCDSHYVQASNPGFTASARIGSEGV